MTPAIDMVALKQKGMAMGLSGSGGLNDIANHLFGSR